MDACTAMFSHICWSLYGDRHIVHATIIRNITFCIILSWVKHIIKTIIADYCISLHFICFLSWHINIVVTFIILRHIHNYSVVFQFH
eukprot:802560_1